MLWGWQKTWRKCNAWQAIQLPLGRRSKKHFNTVLAFRMSAVAGGNFPPAPSRNNRMNSRSNMAKLFHCDKFLQCMCVLIICTASSVHFQPLRFSRSSLHLRTKLIRSTRSVDLLDAAQYAQAEKALRTYLEKNPSSAEGHFLLGYTLFREQRPKDSLAEFTEGAKYQRPQASDLKIVAADYVVLGDLADADKWLTMVANETPKDADAWYLLGRTKYNENRFDEAIEAFQRTLTLRPGDVKAENNLGLSYQGLNRLDDARNGFRKRHFMAERLASKRRAAVSEYGNPALPIRTRLSRHCRGCNKQSRWLRAIRKCTKNSPAGMTSLRCRTRRSTNWSRP